MTLVQTVRIQSETDYCTISRSRDGMLSIGSITIKDTEIDEFAQKLKDAAKFVGNPPPDEKVQS